MAELRKDYILDRYVIIATERGKRPHEFVKENAQIKEEKCFFCPGNENLTPPEIYRLGEKNWSIRVFPNKFSAVGGGNPEIRTDNEFFTFSDAVGSQEIVVETPQHNQQLWDLPKENIKEVLDVYCKRIEELSKKQEVKYVIVFKNSGQEAGTSLVHSHTQILAYNLIPTIIQQKEEKITKYLDEKGYCPYCKIIDIEKGSYRRCFENNTMAAFTPYASRFPFEIWIMPKRHAVTLLDLSDEEKYDLADLLNKILKKLKLLNAPYNYYLHNGIKNSHFSIEVCPRLTVHAGFELGTETVINQVTPENAAEFYRS